MLLNFFAIKIVMLRQNLNCAYSYIIETGAKRLNHAIHVSQKNFSHSILDLWSLVQRGHKGETTGGLVLETTQHIAMALSDLELISSDSAEDSALPLHYLTAAAPPLASRTDPT